MRNELQRIFIERVDDERADELLVTAASLAIEQKLEKKRDEGCGGWHMPQCSNEQLKKMLVEYIEKGDMVDVMNIAAMIYVREQLYGDNG